MRLFVAVDLDDETRAQLTTARDAIQSIIGHARVPPRVTWAQPAIAHVTIRFIGEVSDEMAPMIAQALTGAAFEPFDAVWNVVGTFGGSHNPRVIWIGPSSGLDAFSRLAADVNARLEPLIGPEPPRVFKPHVTLGRVRDAGRGVDWARALGAVRMRATVTRVDHVTLYRSHLSPKGPTYTALSRHG